MILPLQEDLKGRWPKRWFCRRRNSVERYLYWTCYDCGAVRWNRENIQAHNAEMLEMEAATNRMYER